MFTNGDAEQLVSLLKKFGEAGKNGADLVGPIADETEDQFYLAEAMEWLNQMQEEQNW